MRVIIETNSLQEVEQLMALLQQLQIDNVRIVEKEEPPVSPSITKGDKDIDPSELFGMWQNEPRTIDEIRREGWNRT